MKVWVEVSISGRISVQAETLEEADREAREALDRVHRRKPRCRVGGLELQVDEVLPTPEGALPSEVPGGVWELPVTVFGAAAVEAPSVERARREVEAAIARLPGGLLRLGDDAAVAVESAGVTEAREW
ncbi:MAG: hypothetical protein K6U87_06045 [Firmicutes bacterium]|nr:hypothetical protein [Bacillota bacterium]